jgi:hypothetical protein
MANFGKKSDKLGLSSRHYLLDKKTASLVGALEEAKIAESIYKAQQEKRKLKSKKIAPEAFSSTVLELELS